MKKDAKDLIIYLTSVAKGTWWTKLAPRPDSPTYGVKVVYPYVTVLPGCGTTYGVSSEPKAWPCTEELNIGSSVEEIERVATTLLARLTMEQNDEAHQVADCQFQDGSVVVSWQGVEGEGTAEADVGAYKTLGDALLANPLALPVCFDCDPWLADDGVSTEHREECMFKTDGCKSALNP